MEKVADASIGSNLVVSGAKHGHPLHSFMVPSSYYDSFLHSG